MKKKVLIADDMHPSILTMLEELGFLPDYQPNIQRPELLNIIKDYEGLLIRSKTKIDKEFLSHNQKLAFIGRAGAGLDLIDIEAVEQLGIKLFAANEGNSDAVAEHTLGMLLSLFNKINWADAEVRQKIWLREANRGIELKGMTVGIIGYGNMGKALSERLIGFGVEVIAYDCYKTGFSSNLVKEVEMDEIFEKADVLSLHVPLNPSTKMLINDDYLAKFKKNIFLINTSRGEVASVASVLKHLQNGKLRGACLDVLENEKMKQLSAEQESQYDQLFQLKNVILTPHIAGWTVESYQKINDVLIEKIKAM
ncbi:MULTISPECIES: NAD(P)-dependent oxidoreductase [unclassified Arcicella]|uniref:NAD(P)-dependent oxidoreductase n=1 Tax=unclassified Arcicella TaxID=2644986 RepID=UPI0028641FFD|nr:MULTISPECIES: NAD(P)-dependent oxidoreductase [unclassified Arcicella]MDR6564592.1 D-3-phosphoglycerate dehydrogenase [Arcicella sp. BE51]MDR6814481.1 D-3-phosphoglycerate dehydrogenase [Arcicella sp. BE140]MDR6825763.1 D-3-phosphoglycerate dehydrogenase [Arcicella sp. BE139]